MTRAVVLFAEINGKSHVSTKIYPNASAAIRKIEGFDTMFGFSIATPCKTVQSSPKSTYIRFDSKLMLKYAIHRKSMTIIFFLNFVELKDGILNILIIDLLLNIREFTQHDAPAHDEPTESRN